MCHATLHVSTLACNHRYYKLVSPCSSRVDLSTCPNRVTLEGWEQRAADCPFCVPYSPSVSSESPQSPTFAGSHDSHGRRASCTTVSSTSSSLGPSYDPRIYRVLAGPPVDDITSAASRNGSVLPGSRSQLRRNSSAQKLMAIMPDVRNGTARVVAEEDGGKILRVKSNRPAAPEIEEMEEPDLPATFSKRLSLSMTGNSNGKRGSMFGGLKKFVQP